MCCSLKIYLEIKSFFEEYNRASIPLINCYVGKGMRHVLKAQQHIGMAFDQWLETGHFASRPPGEVHGPFVCDEDCLVLEVSFPSQSIKFT